MGLTSRPELPLGLAEWRVIERTYLDRTEKEKENQCPICMEDLHMQE